MSPVGSSLVTCHLEAITRLHIPMWWAWACACTYFQNSRESKLKRCPWSCTFRVHRSSLRINKTQHMQSYESGIYLEQWLHQVFIIKYIRVINSCAVERTRWDLFSKEAPMSTPFLFPCRTTPQSSLCTSPTSPGVGRGEELDDLLDTLVRVP